MRTALRTDDRGDTAGPKDTSASKPTGTSAIIAALCFWLRALFSACDAEILTLMNRNGTVTDELLRDEAAALARPPLAG